MIYEARSFIVLSRGKRGKDGSFTSIFTQVYENDHLTIILFHHLLPQLSPDERWTSPTDSKGITGAVVQYKFFNLVLTHAFAH